MRYFLIFVFLLSLSSAAEAAQVKVKVQESITRTKKRILVGQPVNLKKLSPAGPTATAVTDKRGVATFAVADNRRGTRYQAETTVDGRTGRTSVFTVRRGTVSKTITIPAPAKPGSVSGRVSFGPNPVTNATVTGGGKSTGTDAAGNYTLTGLPAGIHTVTASALGLASFARPVRVNAGQTATAHFTLVDNVGPTAPIVTVMNVSPTATRQLVSWTTPADVGNRSEIILYELAGSEGTFRLPGNSSERSGLMPNTSYSYRVRAQDRAGNWGEWSTTVSETTRQLPTGVWINPQTGMTVSGTINITADVQAFGSGNVVTEVRWSGEVGATFNPNVASTRLQQSWDSRSSTNGQKTIRMVVKDAEGNESGPIDVTFTVNNATTGGINGRVTDGASSAGIHRAKVELRQSGNVVATVFSDIDGSYLFLGLNPGSYQVRAVASGYGERLADVTVAAGPSQTVNIQLNLLPRIQLEDTGLRIQGLVEPAGLSVDYRRDELLVAETARARVHMFRASTGQLVQSVNVNGMAPDFVAHDLKAAQSFLVGSFGTSRWVDQQGVQNGPTLGLVSLWGIDVGILMATAGHLYTYVDRQQQPAGGYFVHAETGNVRSATADELWFFVTSRFSQRLTRLFRASPLDQATITKVDLPYTPGDIVYVRGTRTLIIAEQLGKRLHLVDCLSLTEYGVIDLPQNEFAIRGLAADPTSGRIFISAQSPDQIYIYLGRAE